jgi:GR25 family glycosyltransferase involved in LPS biosynthesis
MNKNFFENCFTISLDHRLDRRKYIKKHLSDNKINFSFFSAVNGHDLEYSGPLLKGEEGCRQTYINLLTFAQNKKIPYLIIFEDDAVLCDNFLEKAQSALNEIDYFDMFYFGANHKTMPNFVKKNIYRATNAVCAHAVCYNSSIFQRAINSIERRCDIAADDALALLHPDIEAFCTYPPLAWQREDYSDIQNKFVKYDWLKPQ